MGSQFVDLNDDGQLDYLTATFDGSPHVAFGTPSGFEKPTHLLDANGERVIISYIWNYDSKKHEVLGRALSATQTPSERCISALAFDWDGDGDYDLLLGSYENGHLYRQMNEGSNKAPKYTGKNIPILAGDQPFQVPGKMTTPRLIDWDHDGDLDLIAGSFGESSKNEPGGAVYLSLNEGKAGAPAFGPLTVLIAPGSSGSTEPTRPDIGLYPEAVDYDGDGDLDLIVGGYSIWTPTSRSLTEAERVEVSALKERQDANSLARSQQNRELIAEINVATTGLNRRSAEYEAKRAEVLNKHQAASNALGKEAAEIRKKLGLLQPGPQRESSVWFYERK